MDFFFLFWGGRLHHRKLYFFMNVSTQWERLQFYYFCKYVCGNWSPSETFYRINMYCTNASMTNYTSAVWMFLVLLVFSFLFFCQQKNKRTLNVLMSSSVLIQSHRFFFFFFFAAAPRPQLTCRKKHWRINDALNRWHNRRESQINLVKVCRHWISHSCSSSFCLPVRRLKMLFMLHALQRMHGIKSI